MLSKINFQPMPLRFLLYTEWILLCCCGSLVILEVLETGQFPVLHLLILAALGGLGLVIPTGSNLIKIAYTALGIGLIFYGSNCGYIHILPMLYLIVAIRSCFLFSPLGYWSIAALTLILFLRQEVQGAQTLSQLVQPQYHLQVWIQPMSETVMYGLAVFVVIKLSNVLLSERKLWTELNTAHEHLKKCARQGEELAAAQERIRIVRNIHDSVGHFLTSLRAHLQAAIDRCQHNYAIDEIQPYLDQASQLTAAALKEVRDSVRAVRSEGKSIPDSIVDLVQRFESGSGISTQLNADITVSPSPSISEAVYRIVQEALTNIQRHAGATVVRVTLTTNQDWLRVEVIDDGCGFENSQSTAGVGLIGMRERIAMLHGFFAIETRLDQGCRVIADIPLSLNAQEVLNDSFIIG